MAFDQSERVQSPFYTVINNKTTSPSFLRGTPLEVFRELFCDWINNSFHELRVVAPMNKAAN